MVTHRTRAARVVERHGRTYAEQAGITLRDKPSPLYRLVVLSTLLSARISAEIAVAAARELSTAGYRTPARMAAATWQQRVDALGRGHYRRYDERTATMLGDGARLVQTTWHGDLRQLHADAGDDAAALRRGLTALPGIGPTGADIFLREVQVVWTGLRPFVDPIARRGASAVGLPTDPGRLAGLVAASDVPRLIVGLVRLALDGDAAKELTAS